MVGEVPLRLSYYSSIFEFAAALSSALVGIKILQDFVVEKIFPQLQQIQSGMEKEIQDFQTMYDEFLKLLVANPEIAKEEEYQGALVKAMITLNWFKVNCPQLNSAEEHERELIHCKATSFFTYLSLSSVTFLLVGGLEANSIIQNSIALKFVADFILCSLSIFGLLIAYYLLAKKQHLKYPIRLGAAIYLLIVGISIFLATLHLVWLGPANNIHLYIGFSSFYILPAIVLILSSFVSWKFKIKHLRTEMDSKLSDKKDTQAFLENVVKSILEKINSSIENSSTSQSSQSSQTAESEQQKASQPVAETKSTRNQKTKAVHTPTKKANQARGRKNDNP